MRKALTTVFMTGILMVFMLHAPAMAAVNPTDVDDSTNTTNNTITNSTINNTNNSSTDTINATTDQSNIKYFNLQYGAGNNQGLLMMVYQAQDGDTLDSIAQKYNISVDVLKYLNQLQDSNLTAGQQIIVAIPQQKTLNVTLAPVNGTTAANGTAPVNENTNTKTAIGAPVYDPNPRRLDASTKGYTQNDLDLLARVVYSEARGESYQGQVAVASVVLNRMRSPLFPHTIAGVVFEPWAFTAVYDGQFNLTPDASAYRAAKEAMRGDDTSNGALFYWNPSTATSRWVWSRTIIETIGHHVFAR